MQICCRKVEGGRTSISIKHEMINIALIKAKAITLSAAAVASSLNFAVENWSRFRYFLNETFFARRRRVTLRWKQDNNF